ncbi:MAG: FK506 binding protein proline rotamase rapamycin-binding protein [Piccolia ochrophora]|nr:MAG: FK506 binding protein proline rotamase rapamycin-binding protein [Piccolia ochrophora]
MGVEKKLRSQGNGTDYPKKGDTVTIEYTGNIYDNTKADLKGTQEEYTGWDEGVLDMSLGESATLIISSDYAYGDR